MRRRIRPTTSCSSISTSSAIPISRWDARLLGTAKTLQKFDRDMLGNYLSTHYRGPNMVVAAAGAVDHKQVVAEVAQKFASFGGDEAPKPQVAMFGKGGSRVVHRDLEQAHLTLALEGVPQTDLSLFSMQVFTNTLGGGMSSRLFQEVREKRGLCYSIYTFHAPYADTGFFGLYTGTDPADAPEMMEVIVDVINDAVETLTEAEIARAKAQDEGRPADGAGKLFIARRAAGTSCACLWQAADGGGTGGAGSTRSAWNRPATPRGACCPAAVPPLWRSAAAGVWTRRWLLRRIDPVKGEDAAALKIALCGGSVGHGPVSFANQRTGRARAARPRPAVARAADVGLSAMGALA